MSFVGVNTDAPTVKVAALRGQTYPLVRVYEKSADKHGISVIAFSFLDGACAWLGLETKKVASHLDRVKKTRPAVAKFQQEYEVGNSSSS